MEHQPYEEWILGKDRLTGEQVYELDAHLADCEECSALNAGWGSLMSVLSNPPVAIPAPGFVSRWEAEFELRKARERQVVVRRMFLFLGAALLITLLLLIGTTLARYSPVELLAGAVQFFTKVYIDLVRIRGAVETVLGALPLAVSILAWILAATGFSLLALLWSFSIMRFTYKGVKNS